MYLGAETRTETTLSNEAEEIDEDASDTVEALLDTADGKSQLCTVEDVVAVQILDASGATQSYAWISVSPYSVIW